MKLIKVKNSISNTFANTFYVNENRDKSIVTTDDAFEAYDDHSVVGAFEIIHSPTWNCQVMSICGFDGLSNLFEDEKTLKNILFQLYKQVSKPLCLIDVRQEYANELDKLNLESKFESEYLSSNMSSMKMYLLDLRKYESN